MPLVWPCPVASSHPPPCRMSAPLASPSHPAITVCPCPRPSPYAHVRGHPPRRVPSSPLPVITPTVPPHLPAGFALLYPISRPFPLFRCIVYMGRHVRQYSYLGCLTHSPYGMLLSSQPIHLDVTRTCPTTVGCASHVTTLWVTRKTRTRCSNHATTPHHFATMARGSPTPIYHGLHDP